MPAASRALVAAVALTLAAGCGRTQVHTNAPDARIYVDGSPYGPYAEITQTGAPGSATVVVKAADGRSKTVQVRRRFTLTTGLLGLVTYGACWIVCWNYPDVVYVEFDELPEPAAAPAGWSAPAGGGDAWNAAPPGYQGQAAPDPQGQAPAEPPPAEPPPGEAPAESAPGAHGPADSAPADEPPPPADDPWSQPPSPSGQR